MFPNVATRPKVSFGHHGAWGGSYLSVTAVLGKRMGDASTNKLDDESIKQTVANAIEIAGLVPPDDELLPRLGPQNYREVQAHDPASISGRGDRSGGGHRQDGQASLCGSAPGDFGGSARE